MPKLFMKLLYNRPILRTFGLAVLTISSAASATGWESSTAIEKLFADANVVGTFVVYDVTKDKFIGHSQERARQRYIPASTFKIPNSLIGLSVGAVKNVDEELPYGGKPQPFKSWEQDMGLRDAIKISNVPVYQELARRIGIERMAENVKSMGYGNAEIGSVVDRFWLDGPLEISAIEQTLLLAKLSQMKLPFPKDAQASVREILLLEQGEDWVLYGKTGWAFDAGIGWWVGWVLKGDTVYPFALNIDMTTIAEANKRIEIGKASLWALGLL